MDERRHAGGGPANVMVIYNAGSPEATAVAEHYRDARALPPGHLCPLFGINPDLDAHAGDGLEWSVYTELVRAPVDACLAAVPYTEDIDYLVTVKGIPDRVLLEPWQTYATSLEAMLAVHHAVRLEDGAELAGSPHYYYDPAGAYLPSYYNPKFLPFTAQPGDYTVPAPEGHETYSLAPGIVRAEEQPATFRRAEAGTAHRLELPNIEQATVDYSGNLFIVTRLDAFTFDEVHALIDRSVAADGAFPGGELLCMHAEDDNRSYRDPECEFTVRHLAAAGFNATWLPEFDGALAGRELSAYFTGAAEMRAAIDGNTYVPGALVSNITSAGSIPANFECSDDGSMCPLNEDQTSNARFFRAGATAVEGAVIEPTVMPFPRAGALLYYTFGYNVAESVFFATPVLYWQNVITADPLTTPYGERPRVTLYHDETGEGPRLVVIGEHPAGIARTLLYIDGRRAATADGDRVEYPLPGPLSGEHILGVAVAQDMDVERAGWPNPTQRPRPEVQGWTTERVEGPPPSDVQVLEIGGCGCRTSSAVPERWAGLGLAALAMGAVTRTGRPRRRAS